MSNILLPKDLVRATLACGSAGGLLTAISVEGVVLYEVAYDSGLHSLAELAEFAHGVEGYQVEGGTVLFKHGRQASIRPPLHREVGANAEFRPSSERKQALRVERAIAKLEHRTQALEKRERALAAHRPAPETVNEAPTDETQVEVETQQPAGEPKTATDPATEAGSGEAV